MKEVVFTARIGNMDEILPHLQSDWEGTKNPYFVWQAIDTCSALKWELPDWVRAYLAGCAGRMVSKDTVQASDLRKILQRSSASPESAVPEVF
jgi:hypothetical protein